MEALRPRCDRYRLDAGPPGCSRELFGLGKNWEQQTTIITGATIAVVGLIAMMLARREPNAG